MICQLNAINSTSLTHPAYRPRITVHQWTFLHLTAFIIHLLIFRPFIAIIKHPFNSETLQKLPSLVILICNPTLFENMNVN